MMSGGKPSVALSVKHTFCSPAPPPRVLAGLFKEYGVSPSAARSNPNGSSFTIAGTVEANLNGNTGDCPRGGRNYQFTIRDDALLHLQTGPAGTPLRSEGKP